MMLENGEYAVPAGKLAVIVTHLEMQGQAPIKQVPLPQGVTFRQITPSLAEYRDLFTRVGTLDWLWYGRQKLSDAQLQAVLNDPDIAFYTLTKDGVNEALMELDFRVRGACELAYFGLTRALIGTGAGRYLMNEAITRAWAKDISRFHVHTCTHDSQQALDFYVRSGFSPYKREVDVDDDPRLSGVLPRDAAGWIPII